MPSLEALEKLLRSEPNDPFLLYGVAQEHAKLGAYATAVEFYDRCIAADPNYCYAYYHKAVALEAASDIPAALAAIGQGLTASARAGDHHCAAELKALKNTMT
ncbi:MAG: tetratricopeptide repeat protein [Phycisphaerales bacterium]